MVTPLSLYAETTLPTVFGEFRCLVFRDAAGLEHVAMVKGDLKSLSRVLCRIHSECLTSEVFGSIKCDCKQQLDQALQAIEREGRGVLLYLRQEGRGIGLGNKIKAYALQEKGADTVDANRLLGFQDDERSYDLAVLMLKALHVQSVDLITNNPDKLASLNAAGISATHKAHRVSPVSDEAKHYIAVKKNRMGHL